MAKKVWQHWSQEFEEHKIEKRSPTFFLMNNYNRRIPNYGNPFQFRPQYFPSRRFDRVQNFNDKYPDYEKFLYKRSIDEDFSEEWRSCVHFKALFTLVEGCSDCHRGVGCIANNKKWFRLITATGYCRLQQIRTIVWTRLTGHLFFCYLSADVIHKNVKWSILSIFCKCVCLLFITPN